MWTLIELSAKQRWYDIEFAAWFHCILGIISFQSLFTIACSFQGMCTVAYALRSDIYGFYCSCGCAATSHKLRLYIYNILKWLLMASGTMSTKIKCITSCSFSHSPSVASIVTSHTFWCDIVLSCLPSLLW